MRQTIRMTAACSATLLVVGLGGSASAAGRLDPAYGGGDGAVAIPLSQAQLADLVGATRPTVNQVLQRLADRNVVRLSRSRIEVLDPAELRRRSS